MSNGKLLYRFFVYFTLSILALTVIVPVMWVFLASFKESSEFYGNPWALPEGFYIRNFIDAWNKAGMGRYLLNSATVTATALLLLLIISVPAAFVLSRYKFFSSRFLKSFFMGGLFINVNYIVVPIFLMLVDADKFLKSATGNTFFLNNLFVLALIYASTALPFTIYLLSGYFVTIPKDFEEAAFVDGCDYFRMMAKIMIPMAKPSIITVVLFNFLSFWNEYIISMTLMTKDSFKTLPVGLVALMKADNAAAQYGRMYAGLVMVMLPTLILYICVQKKLTEGMTSGGIKG